MNPQPLLQEEGYEEGYKTEGYEEGYKTEHANDVIVVSLGFTTSDYICYT